MKEIKFITDLKTPELAFAETVGGPDVYDIESITRLRGEFVGYYRDNNSITLFRDRLGGRNIYYHIGKEFATISTDLAWLAKMVNTHPNWDYIMTDYLQLQVPTNSETFFADIHRVMPGEIVWIESRPNLKSVFATVNKCRYWKPEFGNNDFDSGHLLDLITDAAEYRLEQIDDEPFTSYLSGGIDSSTIALLAKPNTCFSGFYNIDGFSEIEYIDSVISHSTLPLQYVTVDIMENDFKTKLSELPKILPNPCGGLGVIPQALIAQRVSEWDCRHAFTGQGGDEIFLGYNWNTIVLEMARGLERLNRDKYMVRYEPMIVKALQDGLPAFVGGLLWRGGRQEDRLYAIQKVGSLWDDDQPIENNLLMLNLTLSLPAILSIDEAVGRYTGVEPISPLIDHNIVEYVCSVRPSERAKIPKFMLREATKELLPEKVRIRYDKMGFPVPYRQWDWSEHLPLIETLNDIIHIDMDEYKTMDRKAWALYSIAAWRQCYCE